MHTKEPWRIEEDEEGIAIDPANGLTVARTYVFTDDDDEESREGADNAARIVACVNACAGMSNPATEIATLHELVKGMLEHIETQAESEELSLHDSLWAEEARTALGGTP